jgi:alpha-glucosidase
LPWTAEGPSYGFGTQAAHLPQPDWFLDYAVSVQDANPGSTLSLYRRALALRRRLFNDSDFSWIELQLPVLHFARAGGVRCMTNFGDEPVPLPPGEVLLSSAHLDQGQLPSDTTVWLRMP